MTDHHDTHNVATAETSHRAPSVDFRTLKYKKARVKFYNAQSGFGFVTVLNADGGDDFDAYLPGDKLLTAGFKTIQPGEIIQVKHTKRPKGEAVVLVKHPPDYVSEEPNDTPVVILPLDKNRNRYRGESNRGESNEEGGSFDKLKDYKFADKSGEHNKSVEGESLEQNDSVVATPTTLP